MQWNVFDPSRVNQDPLSSTITLKAGMASAQCVLLRKDVQLFYSRPKREGMQSKGHSQQRVTNQKEQQIGFCSWLTLAQFANSVLLSSGLLLKSWSVRETNQRVTFTKRSAVFLICDTCKLVLCWVHTNAPPLKLPWRDQADPRWVIGSPGPV